MAISTLSTNIQNLINANASKDSADEVARDIAISVLSTNIQNLIDANTTGDATNKSELQSKIDANSDAISNNSDQDAAHETARDIAISVLSTNIHLIDQRQEDILSNQINEIAELDDKVRQNTKNIETNTVDLNKHIKEIKESISSNTLKITNLDNLTNDLDEFKSNVNNSITYLNEIVSNSNYTNSSDIQLLLDRINRSLYGNNSSNYINIDPHVDEEPTSTTFSLSFADSYGDGWQDAVSIINDNTGEVLASDISPPLSGSSYTDPYEFILPSDTNIKLHFDYDEWASEFMVKLIINNTTYIRRPFSNYDTNNWGVSDLSNLVFTFSLDDMTFQVENNLNFLDRIDNLNATLKQEIIDGDKIIDDRVSNLTTTVSTSNDNIQNLWTNYYNIQNSILEVNKQVEKIFNDLYDSVLVSDGIFKLILNDTYGDGWDGTTIKITATIISSGEEIIIYEDIIMECTPEIIDNLECSIIEVEINLPYDKEYNFKFETTYVGWADEISWTLEDSSGAEVLSNPRDADRIEGDKSIHNFIYPYIVLVPKKYVTEAEIIERLNSINTILNQLQITN